MVVIEDRHTYVIGGRKQERLHWVCIGCVSRSAFHIGDTMAVLQDVFASLRSPMEGLAVLADKFLGVLLERKCSMWRWMLELIEFRMVLEAKRPLVARREVCRVVF